MKILLCNNNYKLVGGVEVFFHEVARVLENHGHTVEYFCLNSDTVKTRYSEYFPKQIDYKKNLFKTVINFKSLVYSSEAKNNIQKVLDDFKPDLVHCFNIYTGLTPSILDAIKENNIPIVISLNDYKHICPNYKLFHHGHLCEQCKNGKYFNCILNKCSHNSLIWSIASCIEAYVHKCLNIYRKNINVFTFASNFMVSKTIEYGWMQDSKWSLVQNPFDSTKFTPNYNDKNYILFFGRIIEEKGVEYLVKSMSKCRHIPLKIAGDGPQYNQISDMINELQLSHIELLGPVWGTKMDTLIQNARFIVVPSIWHENVGYVILQAFAFGKPVIITKRGGMTEFVQDNKTGLIVENLQNEELSLKINLLWKDIPLCREMGRKAKSFADATFNDQVFYGQLSKAYSMVLK